MSSCRRAHRTARASTAAQRPSNAAARTLRSRSRAVNRTELFQCSSLRRATVLVACADTIRAAPAKDAVWVAARRQTAAIPTAGHARTTDAAYARTRVQAQRHHRTTS